MGRQLVDEVNRDSVAQHVSVLSAVFRSEDLFRIKIMVMQQQAISPDLISGLNFSDYDSEFRARNGIKLV